MRLSLRFVLLPTELRCAELDRWEGPDDHLLQRAQGPLHVAVKPMASEAAPGPAAWCANCAERT